MVWSATRLRSCILKWRWRSGMLGRPTTTYLSLCVASPALWDKLKTLRWGLSYLVKLRSPIQSIMGSNRGKLCQLMLHGSSLISILLSNVPLFRRPVAGPVFHVERIPLWPERIFVWSVLTVNWNIRNTLQYNVNMIISIRICVKLFQRHLHCHTTSHNLLAQSLGVLPSTSLIRGHHPHSGGRCWGAGDNNGSIRKLTPSCPKLTYWIRSVINWTGLDLNEKIPVWIS